MKTIANFKIDKKTKEDARKLAGELGLSLSAIMNAYLKEFIRNRSVYFSSIPRMSRALENLLGGIEKDIDKKNNLSPSFSSPEEIFEYLNNI